MMKNNKTIRNFPREIVWKLIKRTTDIPIYVIISDGVYQDCFQQVVSQIGDAVKQ